MTGIRAAALALAGLLAACAGTPPPDWQLDARGALERAVEAELSGDSRVATLEFARARAAVSRTGRADLVARVELSRCAALLAALQFEPCAAFEPLRADAGAAEQAYAAYLAGRASAAEVALLPAAQQPLARPSTSAAADLAALQGTAEALSRLVAAALWLRDGRASPAVLALAADTAAGRGWRRPLLAWLHLMKQRSTQAGDAAEAARLDRRIQLILQGPTPP